MGTVAKTFLQSIAIFFLSFIGNFALEYFAVDRGSILIGPPTNIDGRFFASVDITNYTADPLQGLLLSVPKETNVAKIISTSPLRISEVQDSVASEKARRVAISDIEPRHITRLFVPLSNEDEGQSVYPVNPKQIYVSTGYFAGVTNPVEIAVLKAVQSALIYAVIVALFGFWVNEKISASEKKAAELRKSLAESESRLAEHLKSLTEQQTKAIETASRMKLLLVRRLSDYSKELQFWRDTVRKLLYSSNGDQKIADKLFNEVSKTLKTYTAKTDSGDEIHTLEFLQRATESEQSQSRERTDIA